MSDDNHEDWRGPRPQRFWGWRSRHSVGGVPTLKRMAVRGRWIDGWAEFQPGRYRWVVPHTRMVIAD